MDTIASEVEMDVKEKKVLRLSLDAKATVKVGQLSRNGQSRVTLKAKDHDFDVDAKTTPYGILLPDHDRLFLYFTTSRVTSDFIADCITNCLEQLKNDFPDVETILLYQDNGPENHSKRTQFRHFPKNDKEL